jgi:hypothetical protein
MRVKLTNQLPTRLLSCLQILSSYSERINIDFITKLLLTASRKDLIIIIMEGLSKHIGWVAIIEADLVAE